MHSLAWLDQARDKARLCLRVQHAPQRRGVSGEPRQRQRRSGSALIDCAAVAALRLCGSPGRLMTPVEANRDLMICQ